MSIQRTVTEFMDDLCESSPFAISPVKARDQFSDEHSEELAAHGWDLSQRELLRLIKGYLTESASREQLQLNGFTFPRTLTVPMEDDDENGYVYVPLRIATVGHLADDESVKAENLRRVQEEYDHVVNRNAVIRQHAHSDDERVLDVVKRIVDEERGQAS